MNGESRYLQERVDGNKGGGLVRVVLHPCERLE
jgi:hypothetical protein